jgi:UDP-N-acetylmuramate: L-alanyl-gamma-D-glutamyl-meso-diaminopimelate ligase
MNQDATPQIHLIAIGGAVMHNLAIALHRKGYKVTGSDDHVYDPSRTRLAKEGLLPPNGWNTENIHNELSGVILGMHARKDNPELAKAIEMGIPVWSFPEFIYKESESKIRTAICGSHGKTTITAMVMHVLRAEQLKFDYLVGAQLDGFDVMVRLSDSPHIILEGDEYLASPLDRRPKFVHYKPQVALLSGIAWDHINVFPTYDSYLDAFRSLVEGQSEKDVLVYNLEDPEIDKIISGAKAVLKGYKCPEYTISDGVIYVSLPFLEKPLATQLIGRHNLQNAAGAALVCEALGVSLPNAWQALSQFPGASSRLQVIGRVNGRTVIRDFAHSPSIVKASTDAVAEQFGKTGFRAILELHTFSSLDIRFLPHYKNCLDAADQAILFYNPETVAAKKLPAINTEDIIAAFDREDLVVITDPVELKAMILADPLPISLLMMSSGPLGGIDLNEIANFVAQ